MIRKINTLQLTQLLLGDKNVTHPRSKITPSLAKERTQKSDKIKAMEKAHDNMIQRCTNRNNPSFGSYGGRAITVHAPWRDRRVFMEYVANLKPEWRKGLAFDRIDNDGNYEPGNVRWATPDEQCANRRSTATIHIGDITMPRPAVARAAAMKPNTLAKRSSRAARAADPRISEIEDTWIAEMRSHYGRDHLEFSDEQRRLVQNALPRVKNSEVALLSVSKHALVHWNEYTAWVEEDAGVELSPRKPKIEFLLKNLEVAMDFYQSYRARTKRAACELRARKEAKQNWDNIDWEEAQKRMDERLGAYLIDNPPAPECFQAGPLPFEAYEGIKLRPPPKRKVGGRASLARRP